MVNTKRIKLVYGSGIDLANLKSCVPSDDRLADFRNELAVTGKMVITMVVRLVRYKRVREYLQAARAIQKRHPVCRFLLIGPQASEGRQAVPLSEIESYSDCVTWLGARDDVPAILAVSDVVVLPSYYREGVPRVLLEAGAMGLALVTMDMPGCRDVVVDNDTGVIVRPSDSLDLGDGILRLVNDPGLRQRVGRNVKAKVDSGFSHEKVADAYADIYVALLN